MRKDVWFISREALRPQIAHPLFNAWWISTIPGLAIVYTGIAFTLLGDGLDTLLRPKG